MKRIIAALLLLSAGAALAAPAEVIIGTGVFPESMTSLADGTVITGSLVTPFIYRAKPGAASAEPWIHLTGAQPGSTSGVLADPASNTLWACVIEWAVNTPQPPAMASRVTALRGFDLTTGAQKARYKLPGDAAVCNDITVAADHTIYVTDTLNARIDRLKPGATELEIWSADKNLSGVDGIAFVGPALYVNSVSSGKIYRVPVGADGDAGTPVEIALPQPLAGPDGMRALGDRLFVAEGRAGQVSVLRFTGDSASVTLVRKTGYSNLTAVSPSGDTLWMSESKQAFWRDPVLAGKDPNPFKVYSMPLPQ